MTEDQLRLKRIALQRAIADAHQEQNRAWCTYVRPNAANAGLYVSAPRGFRLEATRTLPLKDAELLDRSTPTGAFEYGRAVMAHWNDIIRKTRTGTTSSAKRALSSRKWKPNWTSYGRRGHAVRILRLQMRGLTEYERAMSRQGPRRARMAYRWCLEANGWAGSGEWYTTPELALERFREEL